MEMLEELLFTVITVAIPVITYFFSRYLKTKFDKIAMETEDSIVKNTINEVLTLISTAVSSTSQVYVESLKSAGSFDAAAQKIAFENTKSTILSLLSTESKDILATLYGDIESWITIQIEAAVNSQKSKSIKEGE